MKYSSSIKTVIFTFIINFFLIFNSFADNHNIYETIEQLQKDINKFTLSQIEEYSKKGKKRGAFWA